MMHVKRLSRSPCQAMTRGDAQVTEARRIATKSLRPTGRRGEMQMNNALECPWIMISRRSRKRPAEPKRTSDTITPVETAKVYMPREVRGNELPPATLSGPPRNHRTEGAPSHGQRRQEKRRYLQCKGPEHQVRECPAKRMSTEQVATEIRRINAAARRKTIARVLGIDEITRKIRRQKHRDQRKYVD
ncbi:hypothetical protein H4582DRAFT_2012154 [Lactarius indigo]|nr:hypothetical protein H4582DRAFT_2012154 [Lactarius indigo]